MQFPADYQYNESSLDIDDAKTCSVRYKQYELEYTKKITDEDFEEIKDIFNHSVPLTYSDINGEIKEVYHNFDPASSYHYENSNSEYTKVSFNNDQYLFKIINNDEGIAKVSGVNVYVKIDFNKLNQIYKKYRISPVSKKQ